MHAENIFVGFVVPENKIFYAALHPLVTRFLKGVFKLKPSLPRYSVVWDVGTVLKHMQSMAAMEELPLSMLTKKLTTLLALLTAQRCQTLSSLDLDLMQEIDNEIISVQYTRN